jgi:hypothetical protein
MKKIKLNKGLKLNKEAITKLQETQMSHFKGGVKESNYSCVNASCVTSCNEGTCIGAVVR